MRFVNVWFVSKQYIICVHTYSANIFDFLLA